MYKLIFLLLSISILFSCSKEKLTLSNKNIITKKVNFSLNKKSVHYVIMNSMDNKKQIDKDNLVSFCNSFSSNKLRVSNFSLQGEKTKFYFCIRKFKDYQGGVNFIKAMKKDTHLNNHNVLIVSQDNYRKIISLGFEGLEQYKNFNDKFKKIKNGS